MHESIDQIRTDLRHSLLLYRDLLAVVEAESQALRQTEAGSLFEHFSARKRLLPGLEQATARLRQHRASWTRLAPAERLRHPDVAALLRQSQDAIMRILVLDRENEQALLRRGLLAPRSLPSHNQQRPHFVANLYRRQGLAP